MPKSKNYKWQLHWEVEGNIAKHRFGLKFYRDGENVVVAQDASSRAYIQRAKELYEKDALKHILKLEKQAKILFNS